MSGTPEFSRAKAERTLGPAGVEAARRVVAAAPPLSPELREQVRAVFASTRVARPAPQSAAEAA